MMKLENGAKYIHNVEGTEVILAEDCEGRWYFKNWKPKGLIEPEHIDATGMKYILKKYYVKANDFTDAEKLAKYDEIHSWYLWIKRRTHDGKVNKGHVETFLKGLKKEIEGIDVDVE